MREIPDLIEVDCEEIDRQLLPPNAVSDALLTPISKIAPPQGSPFIGETNSMQKILRKMPFLYREKGEKRNDTI